MLQLIKNYLFRNLLTVVLFALLVIAICAAGYYYKKSAAPAKIAADQKILANPAVPVTKSFTDKSGQQHAEISANINQVSKAALAAPEAKRDSIIKKVTGDLSLADPSRILELTQENLQLKAVVLKLRKDSLNKALLAYTDRYLTFQYDPRDSTVRNLLLNLHINQVKYNKTKFLSNSPVYDFYADDPRVNFSGINHFSVAIPPPLIGLTADTKISYDLYTGHVRPSIGLNFRVRNFFFEGRNYYSFKTDAFHQSIAFGYRHNLL